MHIDREYSFINRDDCFLFINSRNVDEWSFIESITSKNVFPFYGIHPWFISGHMDTENYLSHLPVNSIFGIGEIGIDRVSEMPLEQQVIFFKKQFEIAITLGVPVSLHIVKSFDILFQIFKDLSLGHMTGLVHSFSGNALIMDKLIDYGLYISFSERSLKSSKVRDALAKCPLDRLIVETDSENGIEYDKIIVIYKKISEIRKISVSKLMEVVLKNGLDIQNYAAIRSGWS